jgi:hypothetical protein
MVRDSATQSDLHAEQIQSSQLILRYLQIFTFTMKRPVPGQVVSSEEAVTEVAVKKNVSLVLSEQNQVEAAFA